MTPRQAYEEDVRRSPLYNDGTPRRSWDELPDHVRLSWERNPTPREYRHMKADLNKRPAL